MMRYVFLSILVLLPTVRRANSGIGSGIRFPSDTPIRKSCALNRSAGPGGFRLPLLRHAGT